MARERQYGQRLEATTERGGGVACYDRGRDAVWWLTDDEEGVLLVDEGQLWRFTAVAGIATVVLFLISFALPGQMPSGAATGEEIVAFAGEHRTGVLAMIAVMSLALAANLCYITGLREILWRAEGGTGVFATLGYSAGIVWLTMTAIGLVFPAAVVFRPEVLEPGFARFGWDAFALAASLAGAVAVVHIIAFAAVMLYSGTFPRWVVLLALFSAALHLVALVAFAREGVRSPAVVGGLVAPASYWIWTISVAIALIIRDRRRSAEQADSADTSD